jgi:hypothetical protein
MTRFENVAVFIGEKVWLEPNPFPYKYSKIFKPSHSSYLSAYEDGTECSEMSAHKIQTPGNYSEESLQPKSTTSPILFDHFETYSLLKQ